MTLALVILTIVTTGLLIAWIVETVQSNKEHDQMRTDIETIRRKQKFDDDMAEVGRAGKVVAAYLKNKPEDVKLMIELHHQQYRPAYVGVVEKCGIQIRSTPREDAPLALRDAIYKATTHGIHWTTGNDGPPMVTLPGYSQPVEITEWPVALNPSFLA